MYLLMQIIMIDFNMLCSLYSVDQCTAMVFFKYCKTLYITHTVFLP